MAYRKENYHIGNYHRPIAMCKASAILLANRSRTKVGILYGDGILDEVSMLTHWEKSRLRVEHHSVRNYRIFNVQFMVPFSCGSNLVISPTSG